jgi:hypothetical protein
MRRSALLLSTAIGVILVGAPPAFAKPRKNPAIDFAKSQFRDRPGARRGPPGHVTLRPRGAILTWGVEIVSVPGESLTPIDAAVAVTCKSFCSVVTESTAQILSYYSYNEAAICPVIDGYFTNGACYFSGAPGPGDLYANQTNQTNFFAGLGAHIFQTYLYTVAPAYLGHYQNVYHIWW